MAIAGLDYCAACGKKLIDYNHHCDPKWERVRDKIRRGYTDDRISSYHPSGALRLYEGLAIMESKESQT